MRPCASIVRRRKESVYRGSSPCPQAVNEGDRHRLRGVNPPRRRTISKTESGLSVSDENGRADLPPSDGAASGSKSINHPRYMKRWTPPPPVVWGREVSYWDEGPLEADGPTRAPSSSGGKRPSRSENHPDKGKDQQTRRSVGLSLQVTYPAALTAKPIWEPG